MRCVNRCWLPGKVHCEQGMCAAAGAMEDGGPRRGDRAESARDASGSEPGGAVAYRRRYSRFYAHKVRAVEQWSTKEHTVVWAPTSLARNFLWNGVASGTKWKVGEPSVADRRIGTG